MGDEPKRIYIEVDFPAEPRPVKPERFFSRVPSIYMPPSPWVELAHILSARERHAAAAPAQPLPRKMRKRAVARYKSEFEGTTGRRLTNVDIWTAAHYTDQSVFYRYLRGDVDSEAIDRVLRDKPHLHKSQ
jgi:hypothetical protein